MAEELKGLGKTDLISESLFWASLLRSSNVDVVKFGENRIASKTTLDPSDDSPTTSLSTMLDCEPAGKLRVDIVWKFPWFRLWSTTMSVFVLVPSEPFILIS